MIRPLCNLEPEERLNYKINSETKKLWNVQLNLLQELLRVCECHQLKVFISDGTLLGAVRHKGFIPWDDDIDVVMMRDDYDKLVELSSTSFSYPFFFQTAYSDEGYYRGHAQLRYQGTSQILYGDLYHKFNQSVFIDIFVMDNVPMEPKQRIEQARKSIIINNFLWFRKYPYMLFISPIHYIKNIYLALKIGLNVFDTDYALFKQFESLFKKEEFKESPKVGYLTFSPTDESTIYDKKWFSETIYVPFETLRVPIPKDYNNILVHLYGKDYMTPKQCPSAHGGGYLSMEEDYKILLDRFKIPLIKYIYINNINQLKKIVKKICRLH